MLLVPAAVALVFGAGSIPTVEIAPNVFLPMITMGGVHLKIYPDPGNYSMWLNLGGT